MTRWSRNVFLMLGMPVGFLTQDPDTWNSMDDFKAAEAIVHTLSVTNDHAEQSSSVAIIQDEVQCFKSEE